MIKVWNKVIPDWFGIAIHRACDGLTKYAPKNVEIVDNIEDADVQIVHVVGEGEIPLINRLPRNKTVAFFYTIKTGGGIITWKPYIKDLMLNLSYYPLVDQLKEAGYSDINVNFFRTPVGIDIRLFKMMTNVEREDAVLTSGYVAATEYIEEVYNAATLLNMRVLHVGEDFKFGENFIRYERVTDETMAILYNKTKYCNGMRAIEGFELSNGEGILCGSRPICVDNEEYRYWWGDLPIYIKVPEPYNRDEMINRIVENILNDGRDFVSSNERMYISDNFGEHIVYPKIWKEIMRRL